MRSILSISLPAEKKKEIEARAKKMNQSTSAYIVRVFELEKSLISEEELLQMAKKAERDYKAGKTKKMGSLADLM
jgi:predicted DNA-binding protein